MPTKPYHRPAAKGGLLLSCLLLSGCATEQALTEQTQPLREQIVRLERDLASTQQTSSHAALARSEDLAARQAALERQLAALRAELSGLDERARVQEARLARVEQREPGLGRVAGLAEDTARQLAALEAKHAAAAAAAASADAALADRLAGADRRLKELTDLVHEAMALAAKEIFLANGKEAFVATLTEDRVLYPQNDPALDSRDAAKLDELAGKLATLDQEYHLDIQGHTDNASTDDNNYNLGKARAEVVKRYLHERKGISISRMSTLSYGASKPIDPAGNRNRRILVRVLVLK